MPSRVRYVIATPNGVSYIGRKAKNFVLQHAQAFAVITPTAAKTPKKVADLTTLWQKLVVADSYSFGSRTSFHIFREPRKSRSSYLRLR